MSSKTIATTSSQLLSPSAALFTSKPSGRLVDFSKPHKNEAMLRLRNTTLSLVVLIVLTNLLPVPSLWTAVKVVRGNEDRGTLWTICAAELLTLALLALNIVQSAIAIKYPRKPLPPIPVSPAKNLVTPQSQKTRRKLLSPTTSPQAQRSFTSSYVSSPVSTPSRTLHYSMPSTPSPFGVSLNSSTGSLPPTPSPSLAAYYGRHTPSTGHPFNGSTLSQLASDSDEEI
ncbi:hypothetical protein F5I97DRAFT_459867 [Phlebopus sp. FC_14]|nr:hypothetical protein F5I97DRAFT_459867 [Phlebopus sp. FC_14]